MDIFTPYENASDMFVQNITHFFDNINSNYTTNFIHLLYNTSDNMRSGFIDGIYETSYIFGTTLGIIFSIAPFVLWMEFFSQRKRRNVTFIEPPSAGHIYPEPVNVQEPPEPTFEEKYPHKFEHIIKFMDMFDYNCADDKYFKIFNRSTIPLNVNFENATENDFAKLTQLIKVNKIESFDDVFHIIMTDESFKMENDIAQFYYLLYSDYLDDEFQDLREIIINIDC